MDNQTVRYVNKDTNKDIYLFIKQVYPIIESRLFEEIVLVDSDGEQPLEITDFSINVINHDFYFKFSFKVIEYDDFDLCIEYPIYMLSEMVINNKKLYLWFLGT